MAQAHPSAGLLFSNGIKDHFSTAEDFWVAQLHVVNGKLQSPPLRVAFKNIFSTSLKNCSSSKIVIPIGAYCAELHHGCNQLKSNSAGLAMHLG